MKTRVKKLFLLGLAVGILSIFRGVNVANAAGIIMSEEGQPLFGATTFKVPTSLRDVSPRDLVLKKEVCGFKFIPVYFPHQAVSVSFDSGAIPWGATYRIVSKGVQLPECKKGLILYKFRVEETR